MHNQQGPNCFAIAKMVDGNLVFSDERGWDAVLKYGLFYLEEPEQIDFSPGIRFSREFFHKKGGLEGDEYRGFKDVDIEESSLGFSSQKNDQVELFQLEYHLWSKYLPAALADLLNEMNDLAAAILVSLWRKLNIPKKDWDKIAHRFSENEALQYCIFNHFVSGEKRELGFAAHKDSGFVTILHTQTPGLETFKDQIWIDVPPLNGCLTIVLGHSFEILTEGMEQTVKASYHRVRPQQYGVQELNRVSFGVYIGPSFDQILHQYSSSGELVPHISFIEFQRQKAKEMGYEFHPKLS